MRLLLVKLSWRCRRDTVRRALAPWWRSCESRTNCSTAEAQLASGSRWTFTPRLHALDTHVLRSFCSVSIHELQPKTTPSTTSLALKGGRSALEPLASGANLAHCRLRYCRCPSFGPMRRGSLSSSIGEHLNAEAGTTESNEKQLGAAAAKPSLCGRVCGLNAPANMLDSLGCKRWTWPSCWPIFAISSLLLPRFGSLRRRHCRSLLRSWIVVVVVIAIASRGSRHASRAAIPAAAAVAPGWCFGDREVMLRSPKRSQVPAPVHVGSKS